MARNRLIALLLDCTYDSNRQALLGILRYARPRRPWRFVFAGGIRELLELRPDGAIGLVSSAANRQALRRLKHPFVQIFGHHCDPALPRVDLDDLAVGRLAARHFLGKGFRNFGFAGLHEGFSRLRETGFRQALAEQGVGCATFAWGTGAGLQTWLRRLPRPTAILTCTDWEGLQVTESCRAARLRVPQDLAVLGVDNDQVFCTASSPPLSSIETPAERVGYQAAAILEALLRGRRARPEPLLLPPLGVVERLSSEIALVPDPDLAAALAFMRDHFSKRITVSDILRVIPISRRGLELKFRALLRSSPLEELARMRANHATRLLAETRLPLSAVARQSGFSSPAHLGAALRRRTNCSPSQLRSALRRPDSDRRP